MDTRNYENTIHKSTGDGSFLLSVQSLINQVAERLTNKGVLRRILGKISIKDLEIEVRDTLSKISYLLSPENAKNLSDLLHKVETNLRDLPELVLSQFVPIATSQGLAVRIPSYFLQMYISNIHNYLLSRFLNLIEEIDYLLDKDIICLLSDALNFSEIFSRKSNVEFKDLKRLFALKFLSDYVQPKNSEELRSGIREALVISFRNFFKILQLLMEIEDKLKKKNWNKLWAMSWIVFLKSYITKILKKFQAIEYDDKCKECFTGILGTEYFKEVRNSMHYYGNIFS